MRGRQDFRLSPGPDAIPRHDGQALPRHAARTREHRRGCLAGREDADPPRPGESGPNRGLRERSADSRLRIGASKRRPIQPGEKAPVGPGSHESETF